ncbi:MAG: alpha/beta fold hydrolase [Candidatus Kerfeldbacteria bacterium]
MATVRVVHFRHHNRTIVGDLSYPDSKHGKRVPAILLVHGYTGNRHGIFFPKLTQSLTKQGYAVLSIDFNGHGESAGGFRNFTYTRCIEDVFAAVRFLQRQPRINPHAIAGIGHSMGGTTLLLARARGADIHTLVLLAPVGDIKTHERHVYTPAVIRKWRRLGYLVVRRPHLSKPLRLGFRYWMDRRTIDTLKEATHVHQPVLVVHGTADRFVPISESRALVRNLEGLHTLAVVHNGRHGFMRPSDYIFMEREVRRWCAEYLKNRRKLAVVAFVRRRDRYLIMKRSNAVGSYRRFWGVVGGHLPHGADPLIQALLELKEETGFVKRDVRFVKKGVPVALHDRDLDITWVVTPYLFKTEKIKVKLDWEHTALRWVTIDQMPFTRMYPGFRQQCTSLGLV